MVSPKKVAKMKGLSVKNIPSSSMGSLIDGSKVKQMEFNRKDTTKEAYETRPGIKIIAYCQNPPPYTDDEDTTSNKLNNQLPLPVTQGNFRQRKMNSSLMVMGIIILILLVTIIYMAYASPRSLQNPA